MKLSLALGGGAALGWAHIGVLRELVARGVTVTAVSGTSIGALAAVCFAGGRLDVLEALARSVNRREILRFLDVDPRRGSMLGGRTVRNRLIAQFGAERLEDLSIPCAVVAADLVSGNAVVMRKGPVEEAVRASMAIPAIFPPVRRDGMILVDGGVLEPVPVAAARALGPDPVLAVNLQGDYLRRAATGLPPDKRMMTPFRVGRAGLSLLFARHAANGLTLDPPDHELQPAIGHIDVRSFTRSAELIALGAAAVAADWDAIAALG
jgi:NTE family protein